LTATNVEPKRETGEAELRDGELMRRGSEQSPNGEERAGFARVRSARSAIADSHESAAFVRDQK